MPNYIVKFFKTVTGDNGHVVESTQCELDLRASTRAEAKELGIQKFCERERLGSWSLRADRISVDEADFPS